MVSQKELDEIVKKQRAELKAEGKIKPFVAEVYQKPLDYWDKRNISKVTEYMCKGIA